MSMPRPFIIVVGRRDSDSDSEDDNDFHFHMAEIMISWGGSFHVAVKCGGKLHEDMAGRELDLLPTHTPLISTVNSRDNIMVWTTHYSTLMLMITP